MRIRFDLRRALPSALLVLAAALAPAGCSSGPKPNTVHEFDTVISEPMRIRRPAGPGADPQAGPGGPDYIGHPLPDETYDCREPSSLFTPARVTAIRSCVESIQAPLSVTYRLVRQPAPELTILEPAPGSEPYEALPECLRKELGRIPVPREAFFFAEKPDREGYECYSARVDVDADTPLGVRMPIDQWTTKLEFPLEAPVKDDPAMMRVLVGWVLTPVLRPEESHGKIKGRAVPDSICERCFKGAKIPERKFPYPPTWP